jgi:SSS family solute:Na+ symporter
MTALLKVADLKAVDIHHHGFGDGETFSFLPMILGGLFLYISYYGCVQSQVQRVLCSSSTEASNQSLFLNGLLRFPLVASYCLLGVFMIVFLDQNPDFKASLPPGHYDYLLPMFIVNYLPHGIIGFVLVGIFAAAMSSLDSAINSLSAATLKDFGENLPSIKRAIKKRFIFYSRLTTFVWGTLCTFFAYFVGTVSTTVIEGINKIGSVFYGPVLAVFALGLLTRSATGTGVIIGLLAGILGNVFCWLFFPGISWLWWNPLGCAIAVSAGMVVSFFDGRDAPVSDYRVVYSLGELKAPVQQGRDKRRCIVLALFFLVITVILFTYTEWRAVFW